MTAITIIGGGLAGCEAAWQAAERGIDVFLYEMRPKRQTGAHQGEKLAELVCSNSLGSRYPDRATGLLREEISRMGSLLSSCAEDSALPAGGALAVDRDMFSDLVTEKISGHARISLIRKEVKTLPDGPAIIASGPLTSSALSEALKEITGNKQLFFYDAMAPVVTYESIDMNVAFRASRYDRGDQPDGDYINCPFTQRQYDDFVEALLKAERVELRDFERAIEGGVQAGPDRFFEGCLPIEILARRGREALAFGPMRPVGLTDPHQDCRPYAVVQLRQDNLAGSLYNLVGFQTNLKISEQRRVFRMIPGLEKADFARYGQMHRNTYIASPALLKPTLQHKTRPELFFAGQITGVEGYMGSIGTGLLAGINLARWLNGLEPIILPSTTMLGALCRYITEANEATFQPMKANFGLLPDLGKAGRRGKRERARKHAARSLQYLEEKWTGLERDFSMR